MQEHLHQATRCCCTSFVSDQASALLTYWVISTWFSNGLSLALRAEPAAQRDLPGLLKATGHELADTRSISAQFSLFSRFFCGDQLPFIPEPGESSFQIVCE